MSPEIATVLTMLILVGGAAAWSLLRKSTFSIKIEHQAEDQRPDEPR